MTIEEAARAAFEAHPDFSHLDFSPQPSKAVREWGPRYSYALGQTGAAFDAFFIGYRAALTPRSMESAPRDGTWINVIEDRGRFITRTMHWNKDPAFPQYEGYWYSADSVILYDSGCVGWLPIPKKEET